MLIHDCSFINSSTTGFNYMLHFGRNGGVVWNCSFATKSDAAGAISFVPFSQTNAPWNVISSMGASPDATGLNNGDPTGTLDTYVENCLFQYMDLYCADFGDNSRAVVRYCTLNNATLGSHGQESSTWGCRHWEIYNNTFNYSSSGTAFGGHPYPLNLNAWIVVRGGTGVITDNVMQDLPFHKSGIQLNLYSINGKAPFLARPLIPRRASRAGDGPDEQSYIWESRCSNGRDRRRFGSNLYLGQLRNRDQRPWARRFKPIQPGRMWQR